MDELQQNQKLILESKMQSLVYPETQIKNPQNYQQNLLKPRRDSNRKRSFRSQEEDETLATQSRSEIADSTLNDLQPQISTRIQVKIQSRNFQIDCTNEESVRRFLREVDEIRQLGQKVVQLKVIILDSISTINPKFQHLLDRQCQKYAIAKETKLFTPK